MHVLCVTKRKLCIYMVHRLGQEPVGRNSSVQLWAIRWEIDKDSVSTSNATIASKKGTCTCMWIAPAQLACLNLKPSLPQNGVVSESQLPKTATLTDLQTKGLKGVLCQKWCCSVQIVAQYLLQLVSYTNQWERTKQRRWQNPTLNNLFLNFRILQGMFVSIFINFLAISILSACLVWGFVAALAIIHKT